MKYFANGATTYVLSGKQLIKYFTPDECHSLREEYPYVVVSPLFDQLWVDNRDIIYLYSTVSRCYYFFCRNNDDLDYINVLASLS